MPNAAPAIVASTVAPTTSPGFDSDRHGFLKRSLTEGMAAVDGGRLARGLDLPRDGGDREVALALCHALAEASLGAVALDKTRTRDPRSTHEPPPVASADASFWGQLDGERRGLATSELDDLRTLLAILRAGSLRQRRAALRRMSERLAEPKGIPNDVLRQTVAQLQQVRDIELAADLFELRKRLPGGEAREARAEEEHWRRLVRQIETEINAYWDGQRRQEPVGALPGDQRALLLMKCRNLPDQIVYHLSAVLEETAGPVDRGARMGILASLRHSGDARLVSALRSLLDSSDPEFVEEGARALSRIDDPRVRPALLQAFERCVLDLPKVVLAGCLGFAGDRRGADLVRTVLDSGAARRAQRGLEPLEALGTAEDTPRTAAFLTHPDVVVVGHAIRTLARIGDGRATTALLQLEQRPLTLALMNEVEDALDAVSARLELRGEESHADGKAAERTVKLTLRPKASLGPSGPRSASYWTRLRATLDYFVGHVWLAFGAFVRANRRFERASKRRGDWAAPLVAMGLTHAREHTYSQALTSFRRAVEIDRERVERHTSVVKVFVRCFLRRAEQVEREGRADIARGLLDEVLALDLRRVPSQLRYEIDRHLRAVRRRGG